MNDRKSHQLSATDLTNIVVYMVVRFPTLLVSFPSSKYANYNWYYCHFHAPEFYLISGKFLLLVSHFAFFGFNSVLRWDIKAHYTTGSLFFLLTMTKFGLLTGIW